MLQVMCDLRNFVTNLLNDEDIETKPACHNKDPSIFGIKFLACDFEILLDVIVQSLKNNELKITTNVTYYSRRLINCMKILNFLRRNIVNSTCVRQEINF